MSGRITLDNLSTELKNHLETLGLTEEQVNEIIQEALVDIVAKDSEQELLLDGVVADMGNLDNLNTTDKSNIVAAINEVFQSGNSVKQELVATLIAKGLEATIDDTFKNLINDINENLIVPTGDAVAEDVLEGKTFINNSGEVVTGVIVNRGGAQTVTPGTSNKTLNSGYYNGDITVSGSSNLIAANIKNGVNIFGVNGTAKVLNSSVSGSVTAPSFDPTTSNTYRTYTYNVDFGFTPSVLILKFSGFNCVNNNGTSGTYYNCSGSNHTIVSLFHNSSSTPLSLTAEMNGSVNKMSASMYLSNITSTGFKLNVSAYLNDWSDRWTFSMSAITYYAY